jgi:hypothetical protein
LRPFWELVIPMISIFELYHNISNFTLSFCIYNTQDAVLKST